MGQPKPRDAADVARRCVLLELLLQRLGLEEDDEDPKAARDDVRKSWLARTSELGVDAIWLAEERAHMERPIGELSEDDLDDLYGRAIGGLVLLWTLGRVEGRPDAAALENAPEIIAEHGLLGDGSVAKAKAAMQSAKLRPIGDLRAALAAYAQERGKPDAEEETPLETLATVAAHALGWVVDRDAAWDA